MHLCPALALGQMNIRAGLYDEFVRHVTKPEQEKSIKDAG
jgi:hypothetical protein